MIGVRVNKGGYEVYKKSDRKWKPIFLHVVAAEDMMGGELPDKMDVHHLDGNKRNNEPGNLMVCSRGYHVEMHLREKAMEACGNTWYRRCWYCGQWDDPARLKGNSSGKVHVACKAKYSKERSGAYYLKNKEKILAYSKEWKRANRVKKKENK